ncbi:MAG: VOC family protein [Armatimonadetes bacterium]|nr:VOC family protein [Armatimonadota bacterium]
MGRVLESDVDLGWLDVCLRVADVSASRTFYEAFGFHRVEGDDAEGWAVVVNGESRIGLYAPEHMEGSVFSLNFRGGDIAGTVAELKDRGVSPVRGPVSNEQGGESAWFEDPDGHTIFLDRAQDETKKT